jgi:hypothetical protein
MHSQAVACSARTVAIWGRTRQGVLRCKTSVFTPCAKRPACYAPDLAPGDTWHACGQVPLHPFPP